MLNLVLWLDIKNIYITLKHHIWCYFNTKFGILVGVTLSLSTSYSTIYNITILIITNVLEFLINIISNIHNMLSVKRVSCKFVIVSQIEIHYILYLSSQFFLFLLLFTHYKFIRIPIVTKSSPLWMALVMNM